MNLLNFSIMEPKFMWILDNGHGTDTPGKRSPLLDDGQQLPEYAFNRDVVRRLMAMMESSGLCFHQLVPEEEDIPLGVRVERANQLKSSLPLRFVSIHANAFGQEWNSAGGVETYCFRRGTQSETLAGIFQHYLAGTTGWRNRGVKEAAFYVLKYTRMPAILTENGFYTNRGECLKMFLPAWRERIALAHLRAIRLAELAAEDPNTTIVETIKRKK